MIIGSALGRLFDGLTVNISVRGQVINRPVQYHYGNQKELSKWVLANDGVVKYPLVWYIINPFQEHNDFKICNTKLLILQNTQVDWFNTTRSVKSYEDIIEPTWKKVRNIIESSNYISVYGQGYEKYLIKDEPMFADNLKKGTNNDSLDSKNGDNNITLDVVDGRIIDFKIKIKTNCI